MVGGRKGVCKTQGTTKHKEREQGRHEINRKQGKVYGKNKTRGGKVKNTLEERGCLGTAL